MSPQLEDSCPGPGKCHGCLRWCAWCGDDAEFACDMPGFGPGRCSVHGHGGQRWEDFQLQRGGVAYFRAAQWPRQQGEVRVWKPETGEYFTVYTRRAA